MNQKNYEKIYIEENNQDFYLFSFETKDINRIIPMHFHQEIEVIFCLSGKMKIWIDGGTKFITQGNFYVINSLIPHSTQSYEAGEFVVFYFRPNLFLGNDVRVEIPNERTNETSYQRAIILIKEIFDSTRMDKPYIVFRKRSLLNEFIYLLLSEFSSQITINQRLKNRNQKVKEIIQIMEANYTSNLTLVELADLSGYTSTYLSRMFKENTGQTFSEYKKSLCIEHAIGLIDKMELSLEIIANDSGFPNEKSLRMAFKEAMGITPREYIKNKKDKFRPK